jgi:hypothetical protein
LGGNAQKGQGRHGVHEPVYLAFAKFSTCFALDDWTLEGFSRNSYKSALKEYGFIDIALQHCKIE